MQSHGAHYAAVWLRNVNKTKEDVWEHTSNLRRHSGQYFELIFAEITRQLLNHIGSHTRWRQRLKLLLYGEFGRVEAR